MPFKSPSASWSFNAASGSISCRPSARAERIPPVDRLLEPLRAGLVTAPSPRSDIPISPNPPLSPVARPRPPPSAPTPSGAIFNPARRLRPGPSPSPLSAPSRIPRAKRTPAPPVPSAGRSCRSPCVPVTSRNWARRKTLPAGESCGRPQPRRPQGWPGVVSTTLPLHPTRPPAMLLSRPPARVPPLTPAFEGSRHPFVPILEMDIFRGKYQIHLQTIQIVVAPDESPVCRTSPSDGPLRRSQHRALPRRHQRSPRLAPQLRRVSCGRLLVRSPPPQDPM